MAGIRAAIDETRFDAYRLQVKEGWARGDLPPPG
jgi:queuine tRNA-ribosyltransferase